MPNLYRENWPLGWTPNADNINGSPNGLLRADNLTLDETGSLSLIRGTKKISTSAFTNLVTQIYGKLINLEVQDPAYPHNARLRYIVESTNVVRNYSTATKDENIYDAGIISGGGDQGAAFGSGFGHTFITYGTQKIKDAGVTQTPIGMIANGPPAIAINNPPSKDMSGGLIGPSFSLWELVENESVFVNAGGYVEIDTNNVTNRAVAIRGLFNVINVDSMELGGIPGTGTSEDIFSMAVRVADTSTLVKIQVTFLLNSPAVPSYSSDATDYYEFSWYANQPSIIYTDPVPPDELNWEDRQTFIDNARMEFVKANPDQILTTFNLGINTWSNLQAKRGDFNRVGTDSSLNWTTISGIKVTFTTTAPQTNAFNNMSFIGGTNGPLSGEYAYIQVDVQDNSYYSEKSLPSAYAETGPITRTSVEVTPNTVNNFANECWIFRSSNKTGGFYRVKRITGAYGFTPGAFDDTYSDTDALRDNIKLDDYQANLPDGVIGIVCNFKERNWYITYEAIYPSYRGNVSSYDTRYILETSGNTEYNLFITKLNDDTMLLATNIDFYTITGSAGVVINNETEFFDLQIRPLGIKTPSISKEFAVREGNLYYRAADGIRVLAGSSCTLLTNDIDLLFRKSTRHGIAPSKNEPLGLYYIGISKNHLYYSTPQTDNKRALYIYSFAKQQWRYEEHGDDDSITALFVEEDDTVIYSTELFGDGFIRQLDVGTLFDETDNINFKFLTVYDHNQQPRHRKDTYTLKITADTGNEEINVILRGYKDDKTVVTYTTTATFDGRSEKYFTVNGNVDLVKYYQLELNGEVPVCKIYNFSVDYDPRPEQLTYLRLPPSNFGVAGRKRIPEIPMVIDTLGEDVVFTPIIDGVVQPTSTINKTDKAVYHHWFVDDKVGFDIGGTLSGNLFEFYELISPKEVEIVPDPLLWKFVPYTNLGSGSRKRFIQYAIVIDTRETNVTLTPYIDGVAFATQIINTIRKQTVIYTFETLAVGVDIACTLDSSSSTVGFEFYEVNLSECISEKLPPLANKLHIPYTNFGTSSRKRISQFAFTIDTRWSTVTFVPSIDGVAFPSQTFLTGRKETVIYTFAAPAIGVDLSGEILGTANADFEYYGPNLEESVYEKLPPKTQALTISSSNYGIAAKKRIRTIPMVLDTFGQNVIYTPIVDGVTFPTSTFTTNGKTTVLHYFTDTGEGIPFGIDYGGTLIGTSDFEFYGLLTPENVETLPVGKKFDQIGPVQFDKVGKVREIRLRMVATGSSLLYRIYSSDTLIFSSTLSTTPNVDKTYSISCPKGINPNIFRMEFDSSSVFHRFDCEIRVNIGGSETANKRIKVK